MPLYAIEMNDGSVAVMRTVGDVGVEDCLAKWPASTRANIVRHHEIEPNAVPTDRSYRDAWALSGSRIEHNMATARDLHRDVLRRARAPRLAALDVAYQRADEAGDDVAKMRVRRHKQKLRDVTSHPAIEAAGTVEDLRALTVEALLAKPASTI